MPHFPVNRQQNEEMKLSIMSGSHHAESAASAAVNALRPKNI